MKIKKISIQKDSKSVPKVSTPTKSKQASAVSLPEEFKSVLPSKEALDQMNEELIAELDAFVFDIEKGITKVAAVSPQNDILKTYCQQRFKNFEIYQAEPDDVRFVLGKLQSGAKKEIERLAQATKSGDSTRTTELVDKIISYAISEKASDVHVEPLRNETAVRFRIDGMLHHILSLPKEIHNAVIARFKILSNLKIDEYRRPQDGRLEPRDMPETSLRVSTMPTLYGEKIALRVLDDSSKDLSLDRLGFTEEQKKIIYRNMEKPFGMIVTSGPTGSGKTTTLYGLLSMLKTTDLNISTLEDPIEFALPNVNQIQVNPRVDLSFASGLKALLRQDPDIIMVGEIRDTDTVVMAANSAMTGHLVLTTMHTNDAPSAFTRFLEMKVEDFVVASIVNLVIAQRLVRKICTSCGKKQKLDPTLIEKIKARKDVVAALQKIGKPFDKIKDETFVIGEGCDACLQTGYIGRIGIFELLELNKDIHDLVLKHAPADQIKEAAEKDGFEDMIIDGIRKVFDGQTTFEEILRTTRNA